ncbi:hypothetical protein VNO78_27992 [Psophocarpus tetragonolobus]|uniref:MADS-box domain-containing protein n=1 Tax=Psophocarpus tetragonolobus TaxID=3891 RepID=A0AAN9S3Z4_PSOTE
MAPGKVKIAFIADDYKRKETYRKRKRSVLKKTEELSTLCGVEACAIVYGPFDHEPQIWPSESGVQNVLGRFTAIPEWVQTKNMVNQESLIAQSVTKVKEKMDKLVLENKHKEMSIFIFQCLRKGNFEPYGNMTSTDFTVLSSVIQQNLNDINTRLGLLKVKPQMQTPPSEEINHDHGSSTNANSHTSPRFMDFLNVNENETIISPFGDANLQL